MVRIKRSGEATGGKVNRLAVAAFGKGSGQGPTQLAITAARDDAGNLSLVVWAVSDGGKPKAVGGDTLGAVSEVGVCAVGARRVVVAMRDGQGELRLISFVVSADGSTLTRQHTEVAGPVRDFAIASMDEASVSVARRGADRRVTVSTWRLGGDGRFSAAGSIAVGSGKVRALSLGALLHQMCLMVATDTGTLRFRGFVGPTDLGGDGTGGKVRAVSISGAGAFEGYWTATIGKDHVAVRTGLLGGGRLLLDTGLLEVANWQFETDQVGSNLELVASAVVGPEAGIAYEARVLYVSTPVVLVATSGVGTYKKLLAKDRGKPKLHLFGFERQGDKLLRVASVTSSGTHKLLGIAHVLQPDAAGNRDARVLTAAANGDGKLRVEVWDMRG